MMASMSTALDPARMALRTTSNLPEAEPAGAAFEGLAQEPERHHEHDPAGGNHQRPGHVALAAGEEEERHRGEARGPGQERGVRAVAGEVLADRQLEAGERPEHEPRREHDGAACA